MAVEVRCEHCGVVTGTLDDMNPCPCCRGQVHHRYGVQHKEGCPHSKNYKRFLIDNWFKQGRFEI